MNRLSLAVVIAVLPACYSPRGAFVEVDTANITDSTETLIGSGDVLNVRVFQQDAMSARVKVRGDGKVSLPLVNEVMAGGKTPAALAGELQIKLKDFINNPVVTVSLEETRPLTVSVLGEVPRAGTVTLEAGSGVLQALAAAGGLTDFGHKDGIFVLRKVPNLPAPKRIRFTWVALTQGDGAAARFVLVPGDVIVVE